MAFRSIAGQSIAGTATGGQALVIPKPAGTVDGDVLVAVVGQVSTSGSALITPPAGWLLLASQATANGQAELFYRVAASEGASYAFTVSGGDPHAAAGLIASYVGMELSPTIDAVGSQHNASSTSATAPSVAPTVSGDTLVCCYSADGTTNTTTITSTPPGGMTERADTARFGSPISEYSVTVDVQVSLNDVLLGGTSPTGAKTAALSAARENTGFAVLLRPVAAPPPPPPPPASAVGLHMVL